MQPEAYTTLDQLRSASKIFHHAIKQVAILDRHIGEAKTRCKRAKRLQPKAFNVTADLKKNSLMFARDYYSLKQYKYCEKVEILQAKLQELTGGKARQFIIENAKKTKQ